MRRLAVAYIILSLSSPALAQQSPEPSETTEKFGAWTVRCVSQQGDAGKACEVFLAVQGQAGLIAQIAVGRPQDGEETLMASRAPLGVLVSEPVSIALEGESPISLDLPFVTCLANGCLAQAIVSGERLGELAGRETAILGFAERTGRKVRINIPLTGLREALSRIGLDCNSGPCVPAE
jgi:invasion protein IalB